MRWTRRPPGVLSKRAPAHESQGTTVIEQLFSMHLPRRSIQAGENTTSELASRCRSRMTMTSCLFPFVGDDAYSSQPAVLHGLLSHRWLLLLVQMQCRITQHKSLIMQKAAHLLRSRYLPRHSSPYHRCLLKHKQASVLHDLLPRHLRLTLSRNRQLMFLASPASRASPSQAHQGTKNRRLIFHSR